jgi:hypothetical protein
MKTDMVVSFGLYAQILSGMAGVVLSLLIRRRALMIGMHLLVVVFGVLAVFGVRERIKGLVFLQGFGTTALALTLLIYEILSKIIMEKFNAETLFLIPFIVDVITGMIGLFYYQHNNARADHIPLNNPYIDENQLLQSSEIPEHSQRINSEYSQVPQNFENHQISSICVVCQDSYAHFAVLNCGHKCLCNQCKSKFEGYNKFCPVCRRPASSVVKIFD